MHTQEPADCDGGDGPLSASELAGRRDPSDSELPLIELSSQDAFSSFEDLFENAPCGYVVLNLDGQIVQANAAFLELSKLDRDRVIGASFRNLLGSAGAIFFDTQLLPALLLNGRRKEIALDLRTARGRVPVLVNF